MATDATGTPTSQGIPTFQTNVDAPSGKGFNAAMTTIDALITSALKTPFKKAGTLVATRRNLNFIDGTGATITVADDGANDAVNVTIATSVSASGINQAGTLASRPSAATAGAGATYFANDQIVQYISDGSAWTRLGLPAGASVEWHKPDAAVPTGWVKYDGSTLPASTGIYADLYAHLGSTTTTPDTRGRVTIGQGTHVDVDVIGDSDGLAVGSRRPKHKHTIGDTGHSHVFAAMQPGSASAAGGGADNNNYGATSTSSATTGITVGPQTGSEPTDGPAFITVLKIAKL